MRKILRLYKRFSAYALYLKSPFLFAVRLYWGFQFMTNGWGKMHNINGISSFFSSIHIPFPTANAVFISGLEFFGGVLLMLGLGTRFIALLMVANMSVAFWTAEREALFSIFSDPDKFIAADPFSFLFASLILLVFGAGLFSLDALLARRFNAYIA